MDNSLIDISALKEHGIKISWYFADFIQRLSGIQCPLLFLAAYMVSYFTEEGHVCVDLSEASERPLSELLNNDACKGVSPNISFWAEKLKETSVVGEPCEFCPLILDKKGRLYLYRYFEYERILVDIIKKRANKVYESIDESLLTAGLSRLFQNSDDHSMDSIFSTNQKNLEKITNLTEPDWQKIAAITAIYRNLCVISGCPGTGKTSTVIKILALLIEQAKDNCLHIALAAPTGKAAARLKESIRSSKDNLRISDDVRKFIPDEVTTIHRLLGTIIGSSRFRYNSENKLPIDIIIVDESSMIDLPLMVKLFLAIPDEARIILLGDKDQLASVEAGAVLADICGNMEGQTFSPTFVNTIKKIAGDISLDENNLKSHKLCDSIIQLEKSYRFASSSGIYLLSRSVNEGDGKKALSLSGNNIYSDISWKKLPSPKSLEKALGELVIEGNFDYLQTNNPKEALIKFNRFAILCALRQGPYGVKKVCALIEKALKSIGFIKSHGQWYRGQPILITKNDYQLGLFNGDIGIIMEDKLTKGSLMAYFPKVDGTYRKIIPARLPEYELAYALTVHKSQGSEFDKVVLIIPDRDTKILTRELIYTGITRAKEKVEIWGNEDIFISATSRRIVRQSGLMERLWP